MNISGSLEQDRSDILRYISTIQNPDTMRRVKDALASIVVSFKPKHVTAISDGREETEQFLIKVQSLWSDSPSAEDLVDDIYSHRQNFDDEELLKAFDA